MLAVLGDAKESNVPWDSTTSPEGGRSFHLPPHENQTPRGESKTRRGRGNRSRLPRRENLEIMLQVQKMIWGGRGSFGMSVVSYKTTTDWNASLVGKIPSKVLLAARFGMQVPCLSATWTAMIRFVSQIVQPIPSEKSQAQNKRSLSFPCSFPFAFKRVPLVAATKENSSPPFLAVSSGHPLLPCRSLRRSCSWASRT